MGAGSAPAGGCRLVERHDAGSILRWRISAEKWAWYEAQQGSHPIESIIAARKTLVDADLSDRLPSLDLPVLLLHGDARPFVSVALMTDMKRRLPQAELQIFAHAKHGLPFSHAKQCAAVLRGFIERQEPRGQNRA